MSEKPKEALFYDKLDNNNVKCRLCAHNCLIPEGKRGICGVRENRAGTLYTLVYSKPIARHVDPIEKKPLFHFFPGSLAYSIATVGCNFRCKHCQNYDISQYPRVSARIIGEDFSPQDVVANAKRYQCRSISYTYTEPTIFLEYAYDCARLAKLEGLYNTFVTNGYMNPEVLEYISEYLDACNVDLKSFSEKFYTEICGAKLKPVLNALKKMRKLDIWIEVTTLFIPGINDSQKEMQEIAEFIYNELGPHTPWHVTRFYPAYKMNHLPPEDVYKLKQAREIGIKTGLRYVYTGNVPGEEGENTFCYNCGQIVIKRWGYNILEYNIHNGRCKFCSAEIDGVGL
ncbi:MAG TPA: AmmeMemoRadiSam system radical SAM enzyme [Candidatus Omnitrophica bacterium]|nr:AmmeMemoRadiSam system radical SAM enzyme [Candidatus Omnitrophota bacterium]